MPITCAVLTALLVKVHSASTWLAALLKSGAVPGVLPGAVPVLQPVAQREAMTAVQWARLRLNQTGGT